SRAVTAQTGQLVPVLAAIRRTEERGIFNASVNHIRIAQRRFHMPDALKLPRMLCPVVKLMRRERLARFRRSILDELVALALGPALWRRSRLAGRRPRLVPGFASVIGTLDDLPKPTARLRRIDPVRIDGRGLHMVNLPAAKKRAFDVPFLTLGVRC